MEGVRKIAFSTFAKTEIEFQIRLRQNTEMKVRMVRLLLHGNRHHHHHHH